MKKTLLFFSAAVCAALQGARAQTVERAAAQLDSLYGLADKAAKMVEYAKAERHYMAFGELYGSFPDSVRTALDDKWPVLSGAYWYNLACIRSRMRKGPEALDAFEKMVEATVGREETDIGWIRQDEDLDYIRGDERFRAAMERLAGWCDYETLLRDCPDYIADAAGPLPEWHYAASGDPDLARLRRECALDSIAGDGDELSRIKNLLRWVHDTVRHDGNSYNPDERDALSMIRLCREEGRGLNCRMMAQILNECYLAMGWDSRFVTCLPKNFVADCHVITAVYSRTLGKWLWVDPTFNAYVTGPQGKMLSIAEVRRALREGRPLTLNADADWNGVPQKAEHYLNWYMAKNLYFLVCTDRSEYATESSREGRPALRYVALVPPGEVSESAQCNIVTSDEDRFWASPGRRASAD